jgi:hypothetical protein
MPFPSGVLLKITKTTSPSEEGPGMMHIIIRRPHAQLEKELRRTFEGQEDVQVIVDRRYGERRTPKQPIAVDRRRGERRGQKHELVEVVIST